MTGRKDFAELQAPQREGQGMGNIRNILVVAGMLIVVGVSFVGGFMLGEKQGREKAEYAGKQRLLERIEKQRHELNVLKKTNKNQRKSRTRASTEVGDLTFYNTLSSQKVAPAPLAMPGRPGHANNVTDIIRRKLAHKERPSTSAGIFKLQVGSYQRRGEAEKLKVRLAQRGFPAMVEQAMVPDLGLWFRVYTGPYFDLAMANQARRQVQAKMHITGLLLRDKK